MRVRCDDRVLLVRFFSARPARAGRLAKVRADQFAAEHGETAGCSPSEIHEEPTR